MPGLAGGQRGFVTLAEPQIHPAVADDDIDQVLCTRGDAEGRAADLELGIADDHAKSLARPQGLDIDIDRALRELDHLVGR
jgi:hypothetical protein